MTLMSIVISMGMQDNSKSRVSFIKSLESVNAHLQGQLRSQQAEKNRLVVQLQVSHSCALLVLALAIICNFSISWDRTIDGCYNIKGGVSTVLFITTI